MTAICRWLWDLLPANPVFVKIVRGGSRRQRHYWVRMVYLGSLVGLVLIGLLVAGGGMGQEISLTQAAKGGQWVFTLVSHGQVVLICLLAPLFVSEAIAHQEVDRTYDLLLSTPLSNLHIVSGSLLGRLFFVWALLASSLPLFAVFLIVGGVPVQAVFVSFAVAGLSALVMAAVAVTLSVWRIGGRQAVFVFVIAVGTYLVATYTLDFFILRHMATVPGSGVGGTTWLTPLHPLLVLEASLGSATYHRPDVGVLGGYPVGVRFYLTQPFATFTLLCGLLTSVLVFASTLMIRRIGQDRGHPSWWQRPGARALALRRERVQRVWSNPVAWREWHIRGHHAGWLVWRLGFVVLSLTAGAGTLAFYHFGRLPAIADPIGGGTLKPHEVFRLALQILLHVELAVVVLVAIYVSAGCVSREREEGTLDLILTTPITPRQFIWGKLQGLVAFLSLFLAVPVLTLLMASVYVLIGRVMQWAPVTVLDTSIDPLGQVNTTSVDLVMPESPLLLLLTLVPFVALCVMIGMSWSLKAASVFGAVAPSVGIIGCLTMVTGFCGSNAAANVPFVGPMLNAFSPVTNLMMWVNPWQHISGFGLDPVWDRLGLLWGAVIAGGGYSMVTYLMLATMIQSFNQTVRRPCGEG